MERAMCPTKGTIDFGDVHLKTKDEMYFEEVTRNASRIKAEPELDLNELNCILPFEKPPQENKFGRLQGAKEVKNEYKTTMLPPTGYILPDMLEELISSSAKSENVDIGPDQDEAHSEISSRSGRKQTLESLREHPVLLTMVQQDARCEGTGNPRIMVEESQPRNRRKQVLEPIEDLEEEVKNSVVIPINEVNVEKSKDKKVYKCVECDSEFVQEKFYKNHKRNHKIQKQLKCVLCQIQFRTLDDLNDHVTFHMKKPPFQCLICKKCFASRCNLTLHLSSHPGMKPYKCAVCGARFLSITNCKLHTRHCKNTVVESDGSQNACPVCKKVFNSPGKLKLHSYVHKLEHPYKCVYCKSSFISFKSLSTHARNSHSKIKDHKCPACYEAFDLGHLLIGHIYQSRGKRDVFQKEFTMACAPAKRIKTLQITHYTCKVCQVGFCNWDLAHRHVNRDHPAAVAVVENSRLLLEKYATS